MEEARNKLRGLGYDFNKNGRLLQIGKSGKLCTDVPYVIGDNEDELAAMADAVNDYVGSALEKKGLVKETLPGGKGKAQAFIYVTKNWTANNKLLIFIQDTSPYLRAGVWSMEALLTKTLNEGSMLPLIERARKGCLACAILNPNMNFVGVKGGSKTTIAGSETPMDHAHTAFAHLARGCKAANIAIIAHRSGGTIAVELSGTFQRDFDKRVISVQLVNSLHDPVVNYVGPRLQEISINYIPSKLAANRGIKNKDKLTRQMARLGEAEAGNPPNNDAKEEEVDEEMIATGNFMNYDYRDDPIFLDIPLISAGKNLPPDWTPQVLEDHLFAKIDDSLFMRDLGMEKWM